MLISAWWPVKFCRKLPSGNFQILMLSGEAEAKQNLKWEVLFTTTQGVVNVEHPPAGGEDSLGGMEDQGSHTLLVVGENSFRLASSQVPEPDGTIMAACHHLW